MLNNFSSDSYSMILQNKKKPGILLSALFCIFFCASIFAKDLPRGYKSINLGMSFDEPKDALLKDSDFGYHGDRDVSLVPDTSKVLIETDGEAGLGSPFLEHCYFQFFDETLFVITININTQKMDYYSVFTTLSEKYGKPTELNPQSATWKNDTTTVSLEKPLTLKYIDNKLFDKTQNYSNIQKSPTEITREMFLDEL